MRIDLANVVFLETPLVGRMIFRQNAGTCALSANRFDLASASMPLSYQLGGDADCPILQQTAGREAITNESRAFLNLFAAPLDALISTHLAERAEANVSQKIINWVLSYRRWDLCGLPRAWVEPGDSSTLAELARVSGSHSLLVYAGIGKRAIWFNGKNTRT